MHQIKQYGGAGIMQATEFLFCIVMILLIFYLITKLFIMKIKFIRWIVERIMEEDNKE